MKNFFSILFLMLLFTPIKLDGQLQLFDFFEGSYPEGLSKLVETDDGGWVTIFLQSQPIGSIRHNVVLDKYDPCGEPVSTNIYHFPASIRLSIASVLEDPDDSFWVLFVGRRADNDYAALLAHFNEDGEHIENRLITAGEGIVPYTIKRNAEGFLAVFGNVQGPGASNSSITLLNDQLEIVSAKRILNSGSWGTFLPTTDGGYMCRSGISYYKIDQNYQKEWVVRIPTYYATNEPIEVSDGYIFCVYTYSSNSGQNFLLKFGFDGQILWQSPNLLNTGFAKIKLLPNGNIMQIGRGFPETNLPAHIVFSEVNQQGELVRQKSFNPDQSFGMKGEDFIRKENGAYIFVGRTEGNGQLIQSLTTPSFSLICGDYLYAMFEESLPVEPISDEDLSPVDLTIQISSIDAEEYPGGYERNRICFENFISLPELPSDTIMCIGDSLRIDLRFVQDDILWDDGSMAKLRMLPAPGEYTVSAMRCAQSVQKSISVGVEDCSCSFFIPNVFTPNGDGQNDELQMFSNCNFESYEMQVFDRWGNLVFQSRDSNEAWDGRANGSLVQSGVYIARVQCEVIENGAINTRQFVQDITILN